MADIPSSHAEVRAAIASAFEEEYKDLADSWRSLETKAQGTTAIAGVFLAAEVALMKGSASTLSWWVRAPLLASLLLLIVGVWVAVSSLKVQNVARRPAGAEIKRLGEPLLRVAEAGLEPYAANFMADQYELFEATNRELSNRLSAKAKRVRLAQVCIAVATTAFGISAVIVILV